VSPIEARTSRTSAAAALRRETGRWVLTGDIDRASRACGSVRSCMQPCTPHSRMAPTSCSRASAHPRGVRIANRVSCLSLRLWQPAFGCRAFPLDLHVSIPARPIRGANPSARLASAAKRGKCIWRLPGSFRLARTSSGTSEGLRVGVLYGFHDRPCAGPRHPSDPGRRKNFRILPVEQKC
jgi:hypothetical protein